MFVWCYYLCREKNNDHIVAFYIFDHNQWIAYNSIVIAVHNLITFFFIRDQDNIFLLNSFHLFISSDIISTQM